MPELSIWAIILLTSISVDFIFFWQKVINSEDLHQTICCFASIQKLGFFAWITQ